ncbi:SAM-dependent DNA methyltransferase, partial [Klebsiella pneumoniae]|nr:SAM-dependent DNA methyltransferase [Klebsiella pneumoniae]
GVEKYSYIATLEEIRNNDYNLNIPRYVDTFEAEEEIDLNAVAQEIRDLEGKVAEIDKTIADFCKELGIDAPFAFVEGNK